MGRELIFDLGMHDGSDTDYYLKKGYQVVAIDANPALCQQALQRFTSYLQQGQLTILNLAISDIPGKQKFYIPQHHENLASLYLEWAQRETTDIQQVEVDAITLPALFARFGVPFYLKIDIEGADYQALKQLQQQALLPRYISVEDCRFGFDYLAILHQLGYSAFKLQDQSVIPQLQDSELGMCFSPGCSGPFGEETTGEWLNYQQMVEKYSTEVRKPDGSRIASRDRWFDLHAKHN